MLLSADEWDKERDLTGWWLSEKLDGIRAYWDGTAMYSKQGKSYDIPSYFIEGFPKFPLDGELWIDRGQLEQLLAVIKSKNADWRVVKYCIFDLPSSKETYEKRMQALNALQIPKYAQLMTVLRCEGLDHLKEYFQYILSLGGEGVIARSPQSLYLEGRSPEYLKIKVCFSLSHNIFSHLETLK
jgi:DNA ligase-1